MSDSKGTIENKVGEVGPTGACRAGSGAIVSFGWRKWVLLLLVGVMAIPWLIGKGSTCSSSCVGPGGTLALIIPALAAEKPAAPATVKARPRLLDLGSVSCIPCKLMAPILEELKKEYAGRMDVEFIDVNKDRAAASKHGIKLIPTQIFFDADGKERFRHEGFIGKEDILAKWKELGVDL